MTSRMRGSAMMLTVALLVTACSVAPPPATLPPAAEGPAGSIRFTLAEPGRVSLAVYERSSGRLLRELLRGAPGVVGKQTVAWDGLDRLGAPVAPGTYEWRLVSSPGLQAQFQFLLGKNPPHSPIGEWPGNHSSVSCLAVDETGIYLGANHAEARTEIVRQGRDWTNQVWAIGQTYDGHHPLFLAVAADKLYALTAAGHLRRYHRDTGQIEGTWDFTWEGVKANHLSAHGHTLALAFKDKNAVRLVGARSVQVLETISVPAPVATAGNLLIISGDKVVDRQGAVKVAGLTNPQRLAVDGDTLYVVEGAPSQQIKKFGRDGRQLAVFGRAGGRELGRYRPENFRDIADAVADGRGNLIIAEPAAPRRTAVVSGQDGHIVAEYYGGQAFYMTAVADPRHPEDVFFENYRGTYTHAKVDYAKRTWRVHAVYTYEPDLGGSPYNRLRIREIDGHRQFVASAQPIVFRVDEAAGRFVPVATVGVTNGVAYTWGEKTGLKTYPGVKTDRLTADFVTAQGEVLARGWWEQTAFYRFNLRDLATFKAGPDFPSQDLPSSPEPRGLAQDAAGNIYMFVCGNRLPGDERHGYFWPACEIGRARLLKWSPNGELLFAVGRHAVTTGARGEFIQPAGILGETHDCLILLDRGGQPSALAWTKDGLYVGTFLDRRADDGLPDHVYNWHYWKDDAAVGEVVTLSNGDVYWFGPGQGEMPVFKITGWNKIVRQSGLVRVAAAPAAARRQGTGLRGTYYRGDAVALTRVDPRLRFGALNDNDGGDGRPADFDDLRVIWEGELEPVLSEPHVFSVYFTGIFKMWVDGQLVLQSSQGAKPWSRPFCGDLHGPAKTVESEPVVLRAGQRVPVRIEWRALEKVQTKFSGYNGPLFHLHWESRTQDRQCVPSASLYPP